MTNAHLISVQIVCEHHHVEYSFIQLLTDNGLIETSTIEQTLYIPEDELPVLEKLMRLHYEMDINIEGIETIHHLLSRIEHMQHEIMQLKNKLGLYE